MPAPTPLLRPATVADAEAAGRVHHACWVQTYSGVATPGFWERSTVGRSVATWRRLLESGLDATVAEVGGAIVGVAGSGESAERYGHAPVRDRELTLLYLLAAHHGTGLGQALLDRVLPPGVPAQLWVARDNPRALRFYARNGFAPDGVTDGGLATGGIASLRLVR